ncbi:hypothetical protein [Nocardioides sp.]|uniref:hypothetical protein n=1 Tax=Nocardioides sp. TaxID=35761 RepID=UPI00356A9724
MDTHRTTDDHHTGPDVPDERDLDWWHRDHPTFTALTGFFTGLVFVIVVPGAFITLLNALFDDQVAEQLFPLVLVALVAPVALVAAPRTRRFGLYMLIGMAVSLVVVVGVAMLVIWYMVEFQG